MERFRQWSRWLRAVATCAVLLLAPPTLGAQATPTQGRFAWVNSQIIIRQTPGYAEAESTLNAEIAGFRDEVERLQTQLDSARAAYDQQEIVLTPSNRQAKQQELRQMQSRLEQRYNQLQTRASERERELVAPLEERVKGVIEGLRAERNLAFIFDVGAPGNNIVAADRTLDLTTLVIQRLNSAED